MLFNSFHFAVFFPIVAVLYYLAPFAWRWAILVAASCYFYMAFVPAYILILLGVIVVDYTAGLLIEPRKGWARKALLGASLFANVGLLAYFKYFNFLSANVHSLAQAIGWNYPQQILNVILPIGLSFHVFQSMSYTIEVYRGATRAERHFGIYALYVLFFPQLVAGPIERPQNLLHQFRQHRRFDYDRAVSGLRLILIGLFKKVVIADRLALVVDSVYANPAQHSSLELLLGTYFFAFQIYCDFSGYSDIARGAARLLGFELMVNFNAPYLARSVAEFWRRWHISLSTWFRDYVYVPLGGNRLGAWRQAINLFVVFLLSGLWHGSAWTFVFWGFLHGACIVLGQLTKSLRDGFYTRMGIPLEGRLRHAVQVLVTFHLVCLSWVFFRAADFSQATALLRALATNWHVAFPLQIDMTFPELIFSLGTVAVLLALQKFRQGHQPDQTLGALPTPYRWCAYVALGAVIVNFGAPTKSFVYFQF